MEVDLPKKMLAVVVHGKGKNTVGWDSWWPCTAEDYRYEEVDVPQPGPLEVLVKVLQSRNDGRRDDLSLLLGWGCWYLCWGRQDIRRSHQVLGRRRGSPSLCGASSHCRARVLRPCGEARPGRRGEARCEGRRSDGVRADRPLHWLQVGNVNCLTLL